MSDTTDAFLLDSLLQLGFEYDVCVAAIQAGNRDLNQAAEWILGGQSNPDPVPTTAPAATLKLRVDQAPATPAAQPSAAETPAADPLRSRLAQFEGREKLISHMEEKERNEALEKAKKKRLKEAEEKKRILKEIEEDRKRKREIHAPVTSTPAPASSTGPRAAPSPAGPSSSSPTSETLIQVRLSDGRAVRRKFGVHETLAAVTKFAIESGEATPLFHLVQPFPHRSFEGVQTSLLDAGLVPNASLVVTKTVAQQVVAPFEPEPTPRPIQIAEPLPVPKDAMDVDSRDRMREAALRRLTQKPEPIVEQPAPLPQEPAPEVEEMIVEPVDPVEAQRLRNLMLEATARRFGQRANQGAAVRGKRRVAPTLQQLSLGVVADLLASRKSLNPIKTLRKVSPILGQAIFRTLLKKEKLDDFSCRKLLACQLSQANIDGYRYSTNALLKSLVKHTCLTSLSMRASPYATDKGFVLLANLTHLRTLNVASSSLTDAGIGGIVPLVNLEHLNMQGTKIGDDSIKMISQTLHKLRELDLGNCHKITSLSLLYLQALKGLKWLSVEDTRVRDLSSVKDLKGLEFLNLAQCQLDDLTFHHLQNLTGLTHLDLTATGISEEDFISLRALRKLETLKFPHREMLIDQILPLMTEISLVTLDLNGFVNFTDQGAAILPRFAPTLRNLHLSGTKITDQAISDINELKNLTELTLDRTNITLTGLGNLRGLLHLEVFSLANTKASNAVIKVLGTSDLAPSLKNLNVSHTLVTNEGLQFFKLFPHLTFLNLAATRVTLDMLGHHFEGSDLKIRSEGLHPSEEAYAQFLERQAAQALQQQQQQQQQMGMGMGVGMNDDDGDDMED